ncbi:hexitol phosphatase HxpB [Shewanella woodyi]|uniref:HAD-superfamily hydrolase, subfamily IA, variant 3 n=1 Tax=Shewanella woodyi (strain ATCC 51908 / MS32) TaxID=392500 RepID=B1KN88_SHEWM|nr:hexitol phosphatase HxpB [Shewanella woodyi]ACA84585.1 HAD-superfamily hydrolase, subfamily IA, variant 3 [Shewanella woodyi ATCC 51908]
MASPLIKAVIFDMDGVLIDSEPAWQLAEYQTMRNQGLKISYQDTLQTTGLRIDEVVSYWYQRFPWKDYDNPKTATEIVNKVVQHILDDGTAMQGVFKALDFCEANGLKIGLATSSSQAIIQAVLNKLEIGHYFSSIQSAEHLNRGKPHPEVYLNCIDDLELSCSQCVAIEDSFNGLIAARAANMQTIAIPAPEQKNDQKWIIAHKQLDSLLELPEYLQDKF